MAEGFASIAGRRAVRSHLERCAFDRPKTQTGGKRSLAVRLHEPCQNLAIRVTGRASTNLGYYLRLVVGTKGRLIGVGLLLAVGLAIMLWPKDRRDSNRSLPDPTRVSLPVAPSDPAPTVQFLAGDGRPLVEFETATAGLASSAAGQLSVERCRQIAEQQLAALPGPRELMGLSSAVPDTTMAQLLANDVAAKGTLLRACAEGDGINSHLAEVRFTHLLVARRFQELGVGQ